ncbi:hypothetical protein VD0002_g6997 [Verticillium dahliae]|uniref:NmrA family protein n=2 Tax=Verticillium dahliae TaxID=27337 RepID=G2WYM6_VERDV|nr:NmrA family protein [Verticillium dahliae VdLs.17]KAF3344914.1 UNC93-like protein [Verticillium dahliae VDG2]KAH6703497.1 NmrA family protein [Verticillium dahliae]EGY21678.1 NmrA family protein [Verticillium dahliae VdLs.17]PNH29272.1 hypothetical protein BJF96_g7445 [Verticillium dahliae]PNH38599.1 hypothetical protein VD0004_g8243 [Verticillium dahliae]
MAIYLVTQATGHQSQHTITHLLASGAKVHAVVRNPQKIPSVLERPGVTIFKGESTDAEAVARAAQGCTGVFLNTFPIPGLELSQAQTIIEASKKVGIKTIVASTTFFAHEKAMWDTPITKETLLHGYFSSKYDVEEAVKAAGFEAYTILQPAFCHFDFLLPNAPQNFPALSTRGELDHAMDDGATMLYTDADDIGAYAAAALLDPAKFDKQVIAMGHENLTMEEVAQIVSRVSGKTVLAKKRSAEEIEQVKDTLFTQRFHLWANATDLSEGAVAAKAVQAKFGIPFTSLEDALTREKTRLLECLAVLESVQ